MLFAVWGAEFRGAAYSLDSGEWHEVLPGAIEAVYLSNRRIAYATVNDPDVLVVRPFDPELLAVSGSAVSLLVDAAIDSALSRHAFTVSSNGTLAYRLRSDRDLVWVDHDGRVESLDISVRRGTVIRLSPDGNRIAVGPADSDDLQVIDVERRTRTTIPQVPDSAGQFGALWSPNGAELTVNSNVGGNWDLYSVSADGRGELRSLLERPLDQFAAAWSDDGRMLAYVELHPETGSDVWVLPVGGEPSPFLTSSSAEGQPAFSPDGRSMAYVSDESGRDEVYVQAFPEGGAKRTVSTNGGHGALWSPDGRRLFYFSGDQFLAVDITDESIGDAVPLFRGPYGVGSVMATEYDLHPDGQRILIAADSGPDEIRIVQNWFSELERLVPIN